MNKFIVFAAVLALFAAKLPAQNQWKFAVVIGNDYYKDKNLTRLANPVNDADDVAAALESLGFTVNKLIDADLEQMDGAVEWLKNRLSFSVTNYGFFFYAGHAVEFQGKNYLLPVNAEITDGYNLNSRAYVVQKLLNMLEDAKNKLNVVVLDACRDLPKEWKLSGDSRGLSALSKMPVNSIIVYSTSAGRTAADGDGRNSPFTGQLLKYLEDPKLEVQEMIRLTRLGVYEETGGKQEPVMYPKLRGMKFLGADPDSAAAQRPRASSSGNITHNNTDGRDAEKRLWSIGASAGTGFAAPWLTGTFRGTIAPFDNLFLEIGIDLGMLSGIGGVKYHSLFPYAHYSLFLPFAEKFGWHIGAGGGYLRTAAGAPNDIHVNNYFAAIAVTGFCLLDIFNVSYTLQTNFKNVASKVSLGYAYRFK